MIKSVHTLNARDTIIIPIVKKTFNLNSESIHYFLTTGLTHCEKTLLIKNIEYKDLRSSLTPQQDRKEIALIFDSEKVGDNWYGKKIMDQIIPLLSKNSSHSVLTGDFINNSAIGRKILSEALGQIIGQYSNQYFIVYINNLTNKMVEDIDKGLANYNPYIKLIDTTYSSPLKIALSTMLCHVFIMHRNVIIQGHEDDRDNEENINMIGYSFEENGFICKSIQGMLYSLFLSYKIERPEFKGFEEDSEFCINYAQKNPPFLKDLVIDIKEEKFSYLKKNKIESLLKSNILDKNDLIRLISEKISHNYLYDIRLNEYNEMIFNVMIEVNNFRIMVNLKNKLGTDSTYVISAF